MIADGTEQLVSQLRARGTDQEQQSFNVFRAIGS